MCWYREPPLSVDDPGNLGLERLGSVLHRLEQPLELSAAYVGVELLFIRKRLLPVPGDQARDGRLGHPEGTGRVRRRLFAAVHQLDDERLLVRSQLEPPAARAALGLGERQPLPGALPDHGPLELGEAAQHLDEHPAGGGVGLDVFRQALEAGAGLLDLFQEGDEVFEGPGQPVKLPDGEGVAGPEVVQQAVQFGAVPASAGRFLGEDPFAAGRLEGVHLGLDFLRVATGHAGITDAHEISCINQLPYLSIMQEVYASVKPAERAGRWSLA
jgi:hypothetical protein